MRNLIEIPMYQIDAFTSDLFGGNPAAVCPLERELPEATMQHIAAENNLSETAFVVGRGGNSYGLRWFTPEVEIKLCGHATLATSFVLFNELKVKFDELRFDTLSGELITTREGDTIVMDFPAYQTQPIVDKQRLEKLNEALGTTVKELRVDHTESYMAVIDSALELKTLKPNLDKLIAAGFGYIMVTATGEDFGADIVSRFFAPGAGIPEDPVTGSAHSRLVPYWSPILNKKAIHARQISKRGGDLRCELIGDRVSIKGQAVLYSRGTIYVPASV